MVFAKAAQCVGSAFQGWFNLPGPGRDIGAWIGTQAATIAPNMGAMATDQFIHSAVQQNQLQPFARNANPAIPLRAYYDVDYCGGYSRGAADGIAVGGRLAVSGMLGCVAGAGITAALGAAAPLIIGAGALGLFIDPILEARYGINEGVISKHLFGRLIHTDDVDEREKTYVALMHFMGPLKILEKLKRDFAHTRDLAVAKRIAWYVMPYAKYYAEWQAHSYATGKLDYDPREWGARTDRYRPGERTMLDREHKYLVENNPVTKAFKKCLAALRRSVSSWNPRAVFRPKTAEKRELLPKPWQI